jgi:hypothetical protein
MILTNALVAAMLVSIEATPPPPPVLVAETAPIKAAIEEARECIWGPPGSSDYSGTMAADRATRRLTAPVGSAEWNRARDTVIFLVRRRQEQRKCLDRLQTIKRASMTAQDRKALTLYQEGFVMTWIRTGLDEASAMRRLLRIRSTDLYDAAPSWLPK